MGQTKVVGNLVYEISLAILTTHYTIFFFLQIVMKPGRRKITLGALSMFFLP